MAVHVPLGDYMYRVYTSPRDLKVEKAIYRVVGVNPKAEQTWRGYVGSVLAFSAVGILVLFFFELFQDKLPLHLHDPATKMTPSLAWNTAVSFVTNTSWQSYAGESTEGHLVQMAGLVRAKLSLRCGGHGGGDGAGARLCPRKDRRAGQLLGGSGPRHAADLAADRVHRRDRAARRRDHPEFPPPRSGRYHVERCPADDHRGTDRQPGTRQVDHRRRRRVLQRAIRTSVRESELVDELVRNLPDVRDPLRAAPYLWAHGQQQETGLRDRRDHGRPRHDEHRPHPAVPVGTSRHRPHGGR